MSHCIAHRKLLYTLKGASERIPFTVEVLAPRELQPGDVEFQFSEGAAVCSVRFVGLPNSEPEHSYGADSLQALQLAADVEPVLKHLSRKFDFFFPTGESYFEN